MKDCWMFRMIGVISLFCAVVALWQGALAEAMLLMLAGILGLSQ